MGQSDSMSPLKVLTETLALRSPSGRTVRSPECE